MGFNGRVKTLSARPEKTLEKVVDLLGDRLEPQFAILQQRFERTLGDRIRDELDAERLVEWMAARERMARNGASFFPEFMRSIRQACMAAFDHAPPPEPAGPFQLRDQPLSLLDTEVVDEDATLAGIASRHESRASHPLMLLGQRFAVLLERPPLSANALPIGPQAFGRALQHAASEMGLGVNARVALYTLYDEEYADRFESLMEAVDALLDGAGILSGLTFVPLRARAVAAHPERGRGHGPAPGLVAEIVAMRTVNETLDAMVPGGLLADHRLPERREAVAAMVRLVSRHGPESEEWQQCRAVMGEVIAAARERRQVRAGTAEWIRAALQALGYSEVECRRLSEGLVQLAQEIANANRASTVGSPSRRAVFGTPPWKGPDSSASAGRR